MREQAATCQFGNFCFHRIPRFLLTAKPPKALRSVPVSEISDKVPLDQRMISSITRKAHCVITKSCFPCCSGYYSASLQYKSYSAEATFKSLKTETKNHISRISVGMWTVWHQWEMLVHLTHLSTTWDWRSRTSTMMVTDKNSRDYRDHVRSSRITRGWSVKRHIKILCFTGLRVGDHVNLVSLSEDLAAAPVTGLKNKPRAEFEKYVRDVKNEIEARGTVYDTTRGNPGK